MKNSNQLWEEFLLSGIAPENAQSRYYDELKIGDNDKSAENGAMLILSGQKTATSSLASDYDTHQPAPRTGDFSVVIGGGDKPACIVETTRVWSAPFADADVAFAAAYGEWDRTLETWRERCGQYYDAESRRKGLDWSSKTKLLYEEFSVVFPIHSTGSKQLPQKL